jgi:hypothetical protein
MRRFVGPSATAAVILAGATTIVLNPVTVPSTDVRVSTTDLASGHSDLDLLDRAFSDPTTAIPPDHNAVPQYSPVLAEMVGGDSKLNSVSIADSLTTDPVLALSVLAVTPISISPGGPPDAGPANTAGLLRALAVIGTSFGESGADFIEQVGMAPRVIDELAQQVETGQLVPEAAIRRLATASLEAVASGGAATIGNMVIHEVFKEDALIPVIDAMKPPAPPGGADTRVAASGPTVATGPGGITDPSVAAGPTATAEAPDEAATAEAPSAQEIDEQADAGGNLVVQGAPPHRNRVFRPGQILSRIGERIQQRLEHIREQITPPATSTETGDPTTGTESEPESGGEAAPGN